MNRIFPIAIAIFSCSPAHAQKAEEGDVAIHSDARLAVLVSKTHGYFHEPEPAEAPKPTEIAAPVPATAIAPIINMHREPKVIYAGKGYRVQVYNGPDRVRALAVKTQLMRRFPGVSTYLTFIAPAFRVKVGDFRLRSEAEHMLREANTVNKPSMIVPDMVTITTF